MATTTAAKPVPVVLDLVERHFANTNVAKLSESETNALTALTQRYSKSIALVFVHPTHRLGAACDATETLQGATFALRLDAPAPRGIFSNRWGEQLMVAKVVGGGNGRVDPASLVAGINKIGARLASVNVNDTYDPAEHMYDPESVAELREPKRWVETLGSSSGRFVGAFQRDLSASDPEYYLAVRAGLDESAGRHIADMLEDRDGEMTLGEMMKQPLYIQLNSAAERNAQRVLAEAARACRVKVLLADDIYAYRGRNEAPPERGMPDVHMVSNTLHAVPTKDGNMDKYVAYFSRTAPVRHNAEFVALPLDPLSGIRVYPSARNTRPLDSNVLSEGLPFGLERADATAQASHIQTVRTRLASHEGTRSFVGDRLVWSGRSAQSHDTNPLLWRYAPPSARHDALIADALGQQAVEQQITLKPLRVWVATL